LALDLSRLDKKTILGEEIEHEDAANQTWIFEFLAGEGEAIIKTKGHKLYIGFEGPPEEEKHLIAVPRKHAKIWVLDQNHAPDYKFRLKGTDFVIDFPESDLKPGTHAQLGASSFDASNQLWSATLVK